MARLALAVALGLCLAACGGRGTAESSKPREDFMEVRSRPAGGQALVSILGAAFGLQVRDRAATRASGSVPGAGTELRPQAELLLDTLSRDRGPASAATVEFFEEPLCAAGKPRVFGLGEAKSRAAVVSTADLGPDDAPTFLPRLARVALHETAHALGLLHCDDPECLLYPADSVEQLDRTSLAPCDRCFSSFCRARGEDSASRRRALEAAAKAAGISVGPLARPSSGGAR